MLTSILHYVAGRAAKAGIAALNGMFSIPLATFGALEVVAPALELTVPAHEMSIWGYVIMGAIGGLSNWAAVYFKRNR